MPSALDMVHDYVLATLLAWREINKDCLIVGLCGAQGSGKSTIAAGIAARLRDRGFKVAILSLDDIYLPHEARLALAETVHPLFKTRGVPGTHDVALGQTILDALTKGSTRIPRFDKAADTRFPEAAWELAPGPADVILFEGWCVGAVPQSAESLASSVNELEQSEDRDGSWRCYVNAALGGVYRDLFARINTLILLAAPGFSVVAEWRQEQEHQLRARMASQNERGVAVMDDAAVVRFVHHYERLTRHILEEMPQRANFVVRLDTRRGAIGVSSSDRPLRFE